MFRNRISTSEPAGRANFTKYIRIRSEEGARFVEFDFAINDPSLYVELVMPQQAFNDFCQRNQVVPMTEAQMAQNDAEESKWRYGEDTLAGKLHEAHRTP